jgi:hypothetical protein
MSESEVKKGSWKLLIAGGIMELVLSVVCLIIGLFVFGISLLDSRQFRSYDFVLPFVFGWLVVFAFGAVGSVSAMRRVYFSLAVFGDYIITLWAALFCVFSSLTLETYWGLIDFILGLSIGIVAIISLVFIVLARGTFTRKVLDLE